VIRGTGGRLLCDGSQGERERCSEAGSHNRDTCANTSGRGHVVSDKSERPGETIIAYPKERHQRPAFEDAATRAAARYIGAP